MAKAEAPSEELAGRFTVESLNEREARIGEDLAKTVRRITALYFAGDLEVKDDIGPHIEAVENRKDEYYEVRIRAEIAVQTPDGLVAAEERIRFINLGGALRIELSAEGEGERFCLPEHTAGGLFDAPVVTEGEGKLDSFEMLNRKLAELIDD